MSRGTKEKEQEVLCLTCFCDDDAFSSKQKVANTEKNDIILYLCVLSILLSVASFVQYKLVYNRSGQARAPTKSIIFPRDYPK